MTTLYEEKTHRTVCAEHLDRGQDFEELDPDDEAAETGCAECAAGDFTDPAFAAKRIAEFLSGREWRAEDFETIAQILADAGFTIAEPVAPCDCDGDLVPGAFTNLDKRETPDGHEVESCDGCQRFPGDLEAALAVAKACDGEAWFVPAGAPPNSVTAYQVADPVPEAAVIAHGTDPWVTPKGLTPAQAIEMQRKDVRS